MALQLAFVLVAIIIGARLGGIGLGVMGRDRSGNSDVWFRIAAYITSH